MFPNITLLAPEWHTVALGAARDGAGMMQPMQKHPPWLRMLKPLLSLLRLVSYSSVLIVSDTNSQLICLVKTELEDALAFSASSVNSFPSSATDIFKWDFCFFEIQTDFSAVLKCKSISSKKWMHFNNKAVKVETNALK